MAWVAVVWDPDLAAIGAAGPDWTRAAVDDQGPYARGTPFDLLVGGSEAPRGLDWAACGARAMAWTVDDRVLLEPDAPPAVAMVSLMRRRPGTGPAEFVDHWRHRHGPLALRRHVGLVEYRQGVVTATLTSETPEIDGIAQLGFATRLDFETRFFDSDAGRAEIMADVARFMDRPGTETTLVGPPERRGVGG